MRFRKLLSKILNQFYLTGRAEKLNVCCCGVKSVTVFLFFERVIVAGTALNLPVSINKIANTKISYLILSVTFCRESVTSKPCGYSDNSRNN